MKKPISLVGFVDPVDEREALIAVHKKLLAEVLAAVQSDPDNALLRKESIRFFDESLWAVTEITPGRKHDARFVSKGVKDMIEEHNKAPRTWRCACECDDSKKHTDPRKCAEHEHVVPRQQLHEQLFSAGPNVDAIEAVLRRALGCIVTPDEHVRLKPHASVPSIGWERYVLAPIMVWDRCVGDWVKM